MTEFEHRRNESDPYTIAGIPDPEDPEDAYWHERRLVEAADRDPDFREFLDSEMIGRIKENRALATNPEKQDAFDKLSFGTETLLDILSDYLDGKLPDLQAKEIAAKCREAIKDYASDDSQIGLDFAEEAERFTEIAPDDKVIELMVKLIKLE